ncbi:hypothetical protein ABZT17_01360 [Streptomyces sp. NPDC005648]|uniref:hypothetical protein n=1 Tax=Streptomyces sp. NPDC005648 TaxID=3157044 RepID=UPI0033B761CF
MKSTTVCRAAVWIAVVIGLSGTATCTGGGSSGDPGRGDRARSGGAAHADFAAVLRRTENSTDRARSVRVHSTTSIGSELSMTADGVLGWSGGTTGTVTITYTSGTAADLMRRLGTTSMEARYLRDAYYARLGEKFAEQSGGRHWIRYGYDDLAGLGGGAGAELRSQLRTTTPHQSVKLLLASQDVREVGEEKVRGEATTHYRGTLDVADLVDGSLKKQLTEAGVTTETVDIWVDAKDLLVKKVEKGRTTSGAYSQTAYYSDYGVKVSATRPPASDTEDFKQLLRKTGGTGSTS